nr:hypothetical protein Iba_chr08dCG10980 [Ipomoea batatas]
MSSLLCLVNQSGRPNVVSSQRSLLLCTVGRRDKSSDGGRGCNSSRREGLLRHSTDTPTTKRILKCLDDAGLTKRILKYSTSLIYGGFQLPLSVRSEGLDDSDAAPGKPGPLGNESDVLGGDLELFVGDSGLFVEDFGLSSEGS